MDEITPRYEFRAFAQNFGRVAEKIRGLSPCENVRETTDLYIIAARGGQSNTKIRDELMDIKVFVREVEGLEQWRPRLKEGFPMAAEMLGQEVFPAFGVGVPQFRRAEYTQAQFLDEIVWPHADLYTARVYKLRFSFTVNDCITEIAHLLVNGAAIRTVAVESEDVEAVLEAREMVGLQEYENVNYLLAIKRIMGLEPLAE